MIGRLVTAALLRRSLWPGLLLVLLVSGAAPLPRSDVPMGMPPPEAGAEPITPIPDPPAMDPRKVALGERMFADVRLSRDNTRSCASCHDVRTNGANTRPNDVTLDGKPLALNTNTVFNAALSFRLNWEGNFRGLEDQAAASLRSTDTMGANTDQILAKLRTDPGIVRDFRQAYGRPPDLTNLLDAIATYERTLLTPDSRFDRWLKGDSTALSAAELHGYQLFKSFGCISCHQGVNVGGNLFERPGIFHPLTLDQREILRVPSLRNIATTPPYFHDGSAPTLGEAVRRMADSQLDRSLSEDQIAAIVAFLRTLTGTYHGRAVTAVQP